MPSIMTHCIIQEMFVWWHCVLKRRENKISVSVVRKTKQINSAKITSIFLNYYNIELKILLMAKNTKCIFSEGSA